jgi:aspartyl/asparaginyl beta-hydroxylase (cupin superfamily)
VGISESITGHCTSVTRRDTHEPDQHRCPDETAETDNTPGPTTSDTAIRHHNNGTPGKVAIRHRLLYQEFLGLTRHALKIRSGTGI